MLDSKRLDVVYCFRDGYIDQTHGHYDSPRLEHNRGIARPFCGRAEKSALVCPGLLVSTLSHFALVHPTPLCNRSILAARENLYPFLLFSTFAPISLPYVFFPSAPDSPPRPNQRLESGTAAIKNAFAKSQSESMYDPQAHPCPAPPL
jgi:hypothetical protein